MDSLQSSLAQIAAPACANCGEAGRGAYCSRCGQHQHDGPLRVRTLVRDFVERSLSLEGGLLRTFVDLAVRPGTMIRDYACGRRRRYTNPMGYFLLSAAAYTLFLPLWRDEALASARKGVEGPEADAFVQLLMFLDDHPGASTALVCLFFVPAVRILFRGQISTAEACIFSLFLSGQIFFYHVIVAPFFMADPASGVDALNKFMGWAAAGTFFYALAGYFGHRASTYLKGALALAILFAGMLLSLMAGWFILLVAAEVASAK
jgi:hypothetical protein